MRSHLADVHFSIAKTAGDKVLDAYYLKFITWNLKLILKGKILGKTQEELESKINLHAEELIKHSSFSEVRGFEIFATASE